METETERSDMETETATYVDRSGWPPGPWDDEPDRVEWRIGDLVALALRQPSSGHWCGYVGLPPGHPWHGANYDGVDVAVHGGLTFAASCMHDDRPAVERVCHVPREGESDDTWWLGFDCHHAWDLSPQLVKAGLTFPEATYRTLDYVVAEIERMARAATEAS